MKSSHVLMFSLTFPLCMLVGSGHHCKAVLLDEDQQLFILKEYSRKRLQDVLCFLSSRLVNGVESEVGMLEHLPALRFLDYLSNEGLMGQAACSLVARCHQRLESLPCKGPCSREAFPIRTLQKKKRKHQRHPARSPQFFQESFCPMVFRQTLMLILRHNLELDLQEMASTSTIDSRLQAMTHDEVEYFALVTRKDVAVRHSCSKVVWKKHIQQT